MVAIEPFMLPPWLIWRPCKTNPRSVVNAILYLAWTSCQLQQFPKELPAYSTVQAISTVGRAMGNIRLDQPHASDGVARENGAQASPTAGVTDSPSVKMTEGSGPRGFDAG